MLAFYLVAFFALTPLAAEEPALLPPADHHVSFSEHIKPLLEQHCLTCHGAGKSKGGFRIDTRETLLDGGRGGEAVVAGKSGESRLIELVAGVDPEEVMPKKGRRLTAEEVGLLRAWIDQGLEWEAGFSFAKGRKLPLAPRRVELPAANPFSAPRNPIDRLLEPYFDRHADSGRPTAVVGDRRYARRVFLDVIGLLPTPRELEAFVADERPDKRQRLVRELLTRNAEYAEHWMTFWNDALRNDYRGTGYIDGGRKQITAWLYDSLEKNLPYDRFVRELIDPVPGSEGFVKGIVWRGVVNASQTPEMQAAQNISQIFLGVNLKCASCHDSFINDWQLKDSYSLAATFARDELEIHRCNRPTGERAEVSFLFPELGSIDASAPREERMRQLAGILTSPKNGLLTRTIVNRLWARLFGRGIVEPVDDMEQTPWSADLLDWLAWDLASNGHDLKRAIERILTSRAYQLLAVAATEREEGVYVFRGPHVRRLDAEQFLDALSTVTGVWQQKAAVDLRKVPTDVSIRAVVVNRNQLTTALGRPNRDQVLTRRSSVATTLQALELTNGDLLARYFEKAAKGWLTRKATDSSGAKGNGAAERLVDRIYVRALGREPTPQEKRVAIDLVGTPPTREGLEDLLWVVAMLPEFQLIY